MKKVLLTRFGGIGDVAPVMVAATQLKERGWNVTIALRDDGGAIKQTDVFKNTNVCDELLDIREIGPWRSRCVKIKKDWKSIESIYEKYDQVVDFMFITEGNSNCRSNFIKQPTDIWKTTRNSNYINWFDQHLAWCNIDPKSVPDKQKRPVFRLSAGELSQVKKIKKDFKKVFVIHPDASSQARSWYQARDLVPLIFKEYKGCLVIVWNKMSNDWDMLTEKSPHPIKVKSDSALRRSMIVVKSADVFIGVDTGFSHISEGLGVDNICIYSTVPSWTRSQYYKHQVVIDKGSKNPEFYSFSLGSGDPLRIEEEEKKLSKREKLVQKLYQEKATMDKVTKILNTDMIGAELELKGLIQKRQSWERLQSRALTSVTAKMVLKKIKGITK